MGHSYPSWASAENNIKIEEKNMNAEEALIYWQAQSAIRSTLDVYHWNNNSSFGIGLLGAGIMLGLFNGN